MLHRRLCCGSETPRRPLCGPNCNTVTLWQTTRLVLNLRETGAAPAERPARPSDIELSQISLAPAESDPDLPDPAMRLPNRTVQASATSGEFA